MALGLAGGLFTPLGARAQDACADSVLCISTGVGGEGGPGAALPGFSAAPPPDKRADAEDTLKDLKANPRFLPGVTAANKMPSVLVQKTDPALSPQMSSGPASAWGQSTGSGLPGTSVPNDSARTLGAASQKATAGGSSNFVPNQRPPELRDLRPTETGGVLNVDRLRQNLNLSDAARNERTDPVDPATGEFVHAVTDIEVAGIGLPFRLRRSYRSRWSYDGPLGEGWTHTYDQRLVLDTELCGTRTADWLTGTGATMRFVDGGTGWRSEPESQFKLVEGPGGHWTITTPDGLVLAFDPSQTTTVLTSIADPNGNAIKVSWAWLTGTSKTLNVPRVDHVVDTLGRIISFSYRSDGYLGHVTVPGLGTTSYDYDGNGDLRSATTIAGVTETYMYDASVASDQSFVPTPELDTFCDETCGVGTTCGGAGDCQNVAAVARATCQSSCLSDCTGACPAECTQSCQGTSEFAACEQSCVSPCEAACPADAEKHCKAAAAPGGPADRQCNASCKSICTDACQSHIVCDHNSVTVTVVGFIPIPNFSEDEVCSTLQGCEHLPPNTPGSGWRNGPVSGVKDNGELDTDFAVCAGPLRAGWCCKTSCWDCCAKGDCPSELNTCRGSRHSCHDDCIDVFLNGYGSGDTSCNYGTAPGCIGQHTSSCQSACTPACTNACAGQCTSSCTSSCETQCRIGNACALACDHDYEADCKQGCVSTCKAKWAHPSGRPAYGNPGDAGHNLATITNGEGVTYVQNVYEKDIFSPNFDRIVQQTFGDDVIKYNHADLVTPGAPTISAEDVPYIQAHQDRVEVCPKTCTEAANIALRDHLVRVNGGSYLAFREPSAPEVGLQAWPVNAPSSFDAYRWFELRAANGAFTLAPFAPMSALGLIIETPKGRITAHATDVDGGLSFDGVPSDVLAQLLPRDGVALTLVRASRGWVAYRGEAVGALELAPGTACEDELVVRSSDEPGGLRFETGTCSGTFTVRELGLRRTGRDPRVSALSAPGGRLTWMMGSDASARELTRAPVGDPWASTEASFSSAAGFLAIVPSAADADCVDALGAFALDPLHPQPECTLPWWSRGGSSFTRDLVHPDGMALEALPTTVSSPLSLAGCTYGPPNQDGAPMSVQSISDATVVRDAAGVVWTYFSGKDGLVYRVVNDSSGARTERNYTTNGLLLGELRPFGDRSCFTYDAKDNPVEEATLPATRGAALAPGPQAAPALRRRSFGSFGLIETEYDPNQTSLVPLVNTRHDAKGNLVSIEYPSLNYVVSITPDANGRPIQYSNPNGSKVGVDYDPASGQWHHMTLDLGGPNQRVRTAERDPFGRILSLTELGRPAYAWTWRADNQPLTETVQLDAALSPTTTTNTYDHAGNLHVIAGPEVTRTIVRNKRGLLSYSVDQPTSATGISARVTCVGYDGRGLAVEAVDPEGRRTSFSRDSNGLVTKVTRGIWASSAAPWDDACEGNLTDRAALGSEVFETMTRDDVRGGAVLSHLDGASNDSAPWLDSYLYDGFGRTVERTLSDGSRYRTAYDARGQVIWAAAFGHGDPVTVPPYTGSTPPDPSERTLASLVAHAFDSMGREVQTDALWFHEDPDRGRQFLGDQGWIHRKTTYLDAMNAVEVTDFDGRTTHTEFDFFGRPTIQRLRDGQTSVAWTRTPDGRHEQKTTTPAATASGQLIENFDIAGFGVVSAARDAHETLLWERAFDALGRVTTHMTPSQTTVTSYTPFGEVDGISRRRSNGTSEPYLAYAYRRDGQPSVVRDGLGHETTSAFDFAGRPTTETFPDRSVASKTYRPGTFAVASRIDRNGDTTTIGYDVFRQPSVISGSRAAAAPGWEGTTSVLFGRDVLGLRSAHSTNKPSDPNDDIEVGFDHDSLGAVVREDFTRISRDVFGRATNVVHSMGQFAFAYDAFERLSDVQVDSKSVAHLGYTGLGLPSQVTFGNGIVEQRTFDDRGRVTRAAGSLGSAPAYEHRYQFLGDELVRFDQLVGVSGARLSDVFLPEDFGRLSAAGHGATGLPDPAQEPSLQQLTQDLGASQHVEHFGLDAADDWTSVGLDGLTTSPAIDADLRYRAFGGTVQTDGEGNATQLPDGTVLGYDGLGRVVSVTDKTGHSHTYTWDGLGRLVYESEPGMPNALEFRWIGSQLLGEVDFRRFPRFTAVAHVPGPGLAPIAVETIRTSSSTPNGSTTIAFNHVGHGERIALVTDAQGNPVERVAYSAYGEPTIFDLRRSAPPAATLPTSAVGNRLFLAGAPYVADLNMYLMGARWYRPSWGRFISPDPLGFVAGPNRFAYAANAPNVFIDPTGLWQQRLQDGIADVGAYLGSSRNLGYGIGVGYGSVQGVTPGGFLAPSPAPGWASFEWGRAAGLTAVAGGQIVAGGGAESAGGTMLVGGLVAAPETAGGSLAVSAAGGVISVGGAVAQAWGVANGAAAALAVMNANAAGGGAHADDHATSPFGEGPEVSAIRETDAQGAGILASPQHHIFPQSEREFFEQRGFVGANDIDNFTVELDRSTHEAIHTGRGVNPSGGWPGEWNDTLMTRLADTEARLGRNLTFDEIMTIGIQTLERYGLHGPIVPYR